MRRLGKSNVTSDLKGKTCDLRGSVCSKGKVRPESDSVNSIIENSFERIKDSIYSILTGKRLFFKSVYKHLNEEDYLCDYYAIL